MMEWVNRLAALIQGRGGVVTLSLIAIISSCATVMAFIRSQRPRPTAQVQRITGSYDRLTSTLTLNVRVFAAAPIPGMNAEFQSWWTAKIGHVPITMFITKIDRTALRQNIAFLTLTGQTLLVPPEGADVKVWFKVRAVGGSRHSATETIHVV